MDRSVNTPCIKTKDETMFNFNSDTETDSSVVNKNKEPNKSPSMISTPITPQLKKGLMMRQSLLRTSTQMKKEQTANEMDNFNLDDQDDTENKPPEKKYRRSKKKRILHSSLICAVKLTEQN
ncbi:uncharacterized protein [Temnothorax longispinosus]|uniref:uncharacterized protein n=1 Tax=Temnothorax longispinosus TaxID=300112 RepID=UPI003A994AB4